MSKIAFSYRLKYLFLGGIFNVMCYFAAKEKQICQNLVILRSVGVLFNNNSCRVFGLSGRSVIKTSS